MPIKVVKGLLGSVEPKLSSLADKAKDVEQQQRPASSSAQSQIQQQSAFAATKFRTSEAVVTLVRTAREQLASTEKVRDHRDAKDLAHEVAEQIREHDDSDGLEAHEGLESVAAKKHLM